MAKPLLTLPQGYSLGAIRLDLIDDQTLHTLSLRTDDEGGGAYLRLSLDPQEESVTLTVEDLAALAALGRQLVDLVDGR